MVKKKNETTSNSAKIIVSYLFIVTWIFLWSKFELFEWLGSLFRMILVPVGSINFWILLTVPMIPIIVAAIYLAGLQTAKYSGSDNTTKSMFIASAIVFVSGFLLIVLPLIFY